MEMLQDSSVFADAFDAFIKWRISFGEEVVMYGWSDSDELQLRREMKLKDHYFISGGELCRYRLRRPEA